jgi:hypothetical protein
MMMSFSLWAVQEAIYTALENQVDLKSQAGARASLYDHVPTDAVFPYVVFGEFAASPFGGKDFAGSEQIVSLEVLSRYRGSFEVKQILQVIHETLHDADFQIAGGALVLCRTETAQVTVLEDGLTRKGLYRFKVTTQAA